MGAHDFKLNKVLLFSRKTVNINVSLSVAPKLSRVKLDRNSVWTEILSGFFFRKSLFS